MERFTAHHSQIWKTGGGGDATWSLTVLSKHISRSQTYVQDLMAQMTRKAIEGCKSWQSVYGCAVLTTQLKSQQLFLFSQTVVILALAWVNNSYDKTV